MSEAWGLFVASAVLIVASGIKLGEYGDRIAEVTGAGRVFIGSILLAGSTSLPEMATSAISGAAGRPDLAVGNVFGSNIFNVLIIVLVELVSRRANVVAGVGPGHLLTVAFGIILAAMGALALLARMPFSILGIGYDTLAIGGVYVFVVWVLRQFERQTRRPGREKTGATRVGGGGPSLATLLLRFSAGAAVVLVAGYILSESSDRIAVATGLGATFIGSTMVAGATSLPEISVSVAAAARGSHDTAMANVLGSNVFNMLILLLADTAYRRGPLLAAASVNHAMTALTGLILSGIILITLVYRPKRRTWLTPHGAAIVAVYFLGTYFLYARR